MIKILIAFLVGFFTAIGIVFALSWYQEYEDNAQ